MAGHSKFKNIQHRKGAQDNKRAKIFTKLVREIITAAKLGLTDPQSNPRLRSAITIARSYNLPKERIEKAINDANDVTNNENYSEIRYEGFANDGIAIIIETLTDNKNRTAAEIRSAFTKFAGNLGDPGSVSCLFNHLGIIQYPIEISSISTLLSKEDELEEILTIGVIDIVSHKSHSIYTNVKDFAHCLEFFTQKYGVPEECYIGWIPRNTIIIEDEEKAKKLLKLIDLLEESDDVQRLFSNYELSDKIYEKMTSPQ